MEHYLDNSATTAVSKAAADKAYRVMTEVYGNPSSLHAKGLDAERELEQAVGRFVAALPEAEKAVFILRYWHLIPIAEIAERLHFSQSKTKSMLFRTRNKPKNYLKEEGLCLIR